MFQHFREFSVSLLNCCPNSWKHKRMRAVYCGCLCGGWDVSSWRNLWIHIRIHQLETSQPPHRRLQYTALILLCFHEFGQQFSRLFVFCVGPAVTHLMYCSLSKLIVLTPLYFPSFISRGAPCQPAWETTISKRWNYGREMSDQI
jgi:hypothetical protein